MWILHAFSQIYFISRGSPENHSYTLNNFRIIFPAAAFGKPLSGIIHGCIFEFAINLRNYKLMNWHTPQNAGRFLQLVLIIQKYKAF